MDAGSANAGIDVGAAAFWLFIGAAVVVTSWAKSRREAEKHETLRRIMEKTGAIDEARLKELFAPEPPSQWLHPPPRPPGSAYRTLRVTGTIVMFFAAGLAAFSLILARTGEDVIPPPRRTWEPQPIMTIAKERQDSGSIGLAIASGIALLGAGLFFCSRFTEPPPPRDGRDKPPAR